jgi:hypothetical protein
MPQHQFARSAALLALLLASTACDARSAAPARPQQEHKITGHVTATGSGILEGARVVACSVPYQECKSEIEATLKKILGNIYSYELRLPGPGPYQIVAWKDVDGDGNTNAGDWVGVARRGEGITAPTGLLRIEMTPLTGDQAKAQASNGDVPRLAGSWSQSSTSQELVLTSKIKLQPAMATGYGTNLGGTFGPGSATNTTLVTESTPVTVRRTMNLAIRADGSFDWKISKTQPDGSRCTKTIDQLKQGRITTSAGKITFNIQGGTDAWRSSCGKGGEGTIKPSSETYSYSAAGGTLAIKGPGGVNWSFRRG